ncbi:autophagy-related protein 9A [Trichogramma pretiosum]|uniref:autophagy-related protein 9A n=1 Tax=Trichogramma pretiosum TaxID=7493 RepID=UPI0006C9590A|nr:autophagy-related protein 9A [Trichogramma pretiosum]XP_014231889.1 autophagy-related protein 9A [Trichogramma pretiosum]
MHKMDIESSYQQLEQVLEDEEGEDEDEAGRDNYHEDEGVHDHVIHVVPETGKTPWNHIEDLDSFFIRVYHYHQNHGFLCMMLQEVLELGQFVFIVGLLTFLFHGVDYAILFKDRIPSGHNKTAINDAILPADEAFASMGFFTWISLFFASIFWLFGAVRVCYHLVQFWDIKAFFNDAMKIRDCDLESLQWHDVLKRIILVQREQEMCIHKKDLTELDVYHRMLRFKNYMVAMVNKSLLPVQLKIPFHGNEIFLSQGLQYNYELLLFWGPWSPFENNWHLREDYKKINKRQELAARLANHIFWIGIVNFVLCPVIFVWQILHFFFTYGELLNREPGVLGLHTWSTYSRLYLRHFNELDHELRARLNRAYRPASKYMNNYTPPVTTILARNMAFVSGSVFAVCVALAFYDEDFLTVEHALMIMTIAGSVAHLTRTMVPDENLVWCPDSLLTAVLAHTHYGPDSWRGQAHAPATRSQMAQLFQSRAVYLIKELFSPIVTPYLLCFHLRYRALDIVDFFRNFTVELTGVGDVCSFAQMDIKKHGNPAWQTQKRKIGGTLASNPYTQAEDGKTELSLINFMLTNPEWKPPVLAENFVQALRDRVKHEAAAVAMAEANPLHASISSLTNLGPEYNGIVTSVLRSNFLNPIGFATTTTAAAAEPQLLQQQQASTSILLNDGSMQRSCATTSSCAHNTSTQAMNMSLSALYLHEMHKRHVHNQQPGSGAAGHAAAAGHACTSRSIWSQSPLHESQHHHHQDVDDRSPLLQHPDSSLRYPSNT